MNYIRELNAFYDELETNTLSTSCIVLWHALMHTSSKAGWPEWFAVAVKTLELKTGLERRTIERCRNTLEQSGMLKWKPRNGNKSALYSMISLVRLYDAHDVVQPVVQHVAQYVAQPVAINKQNETYTTAHANEPKTVGEAYSHVFKQLIMPPNISSFLVPLVTQFGEQYAVEIILETGEAATNPSLRYMQTVHEGWQKRGVSSRAEAKIKPLKPRTTASLPLVTISEEEAAQLERYANAGLRT